MRLDADIIPGESLGGLHLFSNALDALPHLEGDWDLREKSSPEGNFTYFTAENRFSISVDNEDLRITCLVAYPGYTGKLYGYIHTGMTFADLLRHSPPVRRKALHMFQGFLYVDQEESTAFLLPPHLDDLDNLLDLPADLPLNALYVMPPARRRHIRKNGQPTWEFIQY